MPNHVKNLIMLNGPVDDVFRAKDLLICGNHQLDGSRPLDSFISKDGDGDLIDFGRVIPMPDILKKVISPIRKGENGRTMLYAEYDNPFSSKSIEATEEEQAELDQYPFESWYDWSVSNWGTKWNGYDFQQVSSQASYEFSFNTAWSFPHPIIDTLVHRFPRVSFDVLWFDEGWCHAGKGTVASGTGMTSTEELYADPDPFLYAEIYGSPPEECYTDTISREDILRIGANFLCEDVREASDSEGYYPITATILSDDPDLTDMELSTVRAMRDILSAEENSTIEF